MRDIFTCFSPCDLIGHTKKINSSHLSEVFPHAKRGNFWWSALEQFRELEEQSEVYSLGAFSHNTNDLNDVRIKKEESFWKGGTTSLSPVLHSSGGYFAAFLPQWSAFLKVQFIPDTFIILLLFCSNFRLSCCAISFVAWAIFIPYTGELLHNLSSSQLRYFKMNTLKWIRIAKLNSRWINLQTQLWDWWRRILMIWFRNVDLGGKSLDGNSLKWFYITTDINLKNDHFNGFIAFKT